ncbi:MAG: hypothetical protein RLY50_1181 [Actinomycetota bacterium]|jgi:hypothetical protein
MADTATVLTFLSAIRIPRSFLGLGLIAVIGLVALGAFASRGGTRKRPQK